MMSEADLLKKNTPRISKAHPAYNYYPSPEGMISSEVLELVKRLNKQGISPSFSAHSAKDVHL